MNRFIKAAHAALLLAATGLCLMGGVFLWHLDHALKAAQEQVSAVSVEAKSALDQLNRTLQIVNRPCGGGHPCGTLADVSKTLNTLRMTAGQVETAANHEDKRLTLVDAQEEQFASDTHAVLIRASTSLDSLNETIRGAQPVEAGLGDEVTALQQATLKLSALESDPNLTAIAGNLNQASISLAGVTDNANKITKDAADEVHALMHPPKKTFWQAIFAVVHAATPPLF